MSPADRSDLGASARPLRALILLTDAYGGRGGIALYNRHLIRGVCEHPRIGRVVALPRQIYYTLEPLPPRLDYRVEAAVGKAQFLQACLRLAFSAERFDIVVCTHLHLLPLAWLLALRFRCPVLPVVYGRDAWTPTAHAFANHLCGRLKGFISIRHLTARRLIEWSGMGHRNYFYLPNCVDRTQYGRAQRREDLVARYGLAGKTVIMTSGRLDAGDDLRKGFDEVLEVLPQLRQQVAGLTYLVVGDGEDKPRLEAKARALGVDDITVFTGYVSEDEKADHYRLADVFAMPGSNPAFDTYPFRFVFLEALACGLPVVGARLTDEWEVADPDTRMIIQVDPNDPRDIERGILEALARRERTVSPLLDKFYYEGFRDRLHGIFDRVVGGTLAAAAG